MIYLKSIELTNLFSFEKLSYNFSTSAKLLSGVNETDIGQNSNGSGKSSVTESIYLALFGDSVREQSVLSDVVRDGTESGSVILTLDNKLNNEQVVIERTFSVKKSSTCKISINGIEKIQATVSEYNNFINDYVDIDKNIIKRFFLISKDNYIPFMLASDVQKKDYIISLIELDVFGTIDKKLKVEEKEFETSLLTTSTTLSLFQKRLSDLQNNEQYVKEVYLEADIKINEDKIKNVELEINEIENSVIDNFLDQPELYSLLHTSNQLKQSYIDFSEKIKTTIFDLKSEKEHVRNTFYLVINEKNDAVTEIKNTINEVKANIKVLENAEHTINDKLEHIITCPACNHDFVIQDDIPIEEYEKRLRSIGKDKIKTKNELIVHEEALSVVQNQFKTTEESKNNSLQAIENQIKENVVKDEENNHLLLKVNEVIRQTTEQIKIYEDKKELVKNNLQIKNEKIGKCKYKLIYLHEEINKLSEIKKDRLNSVRNDLDRLENDISLTTQEKISIEDKLIEVNQWKINFIQFKSFVISHYLEHVNRLVNGYLSKITENFSLSIKDGSYSKKGVHHEKISIRVFKSSQEVNYTKLSRGEKNRIDLGIILAFRHLYMQKSNKGGLNFLTLDEVLSDMDHQGIDTIIQSLNKLFIPSLIVTQLSADSFQNEVVTVRKINGISTIDE